MNELEINFGQGQVLPVASLEQSSLLTQALPRSFGFYDLGEVQLLTPAAPLLSTEGLQGRLNIAFQIQGDTRALLVLSTEKVGQDTSIFEEIGNVILGRMATHLQRELGWNTMVSPPTTLTEAQWERVKLGTPQGPWTFINHEYSICLEAGILTFNILILTTNQEEAGNA